jgi:GntR family transcriptional regulator of vanillate catabolism
MKPGQRVITALRKMIASGELRDGERIAEIPTAERLGVSRMPVRTALRSLEQEGLVVRLGARGYAARTATASQVTGAIEVRGVLEGLAARQVALRNGRASIADKLAQCMEHGDRIFAKDWIAEADVESYYRYNLAFHNLLIAGSQNEAIAVALARNDHLPFASASAMSLDWKDGQNIFDHLRAAHEQHAGVVAAIKDGDADCAERLMREHARISLNNVNRFERLGREATDRD